MHEFEALGPQRRIVAAMMANLIEHRSSQEVGPGHGRVGVKLPLQVLPREPVADLRIRGEQQDLAAVDQLERQHQACIVGRTVQLQRKFRGGVHIGIVDAAP